MNEHSPARPRKGRGSKPRVNVAARREEYIRVASRVFLDKGLGVATMQDIADAAGVPKVLIYRIFPSKHALLDAIRDFVIGRIEDAYQLPVHIYGARAQQIAHAAQTCPEAFLLIFRYGQTGIERPDWAEALRETIGGYTLRRWFMPGPDAPPGAEERARYASRLNTGPFIETLIRWIDGEDGLDEETRLRWWGRIQREFHLQSREAFRLGSMPTTPYKAPGED
ncbi:helix-turn-helix domain-containing protein [Phenylobacterium sp.]|uniref:TetR/AcrR family transcriptional regulator n=1 Tax=Phenylobacterium sp. TaxID=1871053 RepID=UPI002F425D38